MPHPPSVLRVSLALVALALACARASAPNDAGTPPAPPPAPAPAATPAPPPISEAEHLAQLGCPEGCCGRGASCHSYYSSEAYRHDLDQIRLAALELAQLRPGMSVADIGAGQGFIAGRAAHQVAPDGVVYATDIDPAQIKALGRATGGEKVRNMRARLVRRPRDTGLDDLRAESLSAMFVINSVNFRRRGDPQADEAYLKRLARLLVPGGKLVYHTDWLDSELMDKAEVTALFARAGFRPPTDVPLPATLPPESCYCAGGSTPQLVQRGYLLVFEKP